MHIGISTTAKSLCPSCKSQQQREGEGVDYTVYSCIIFQTILLRLLSSLQIAFYSVLKEMDCMDMNCYDVLHLEYCFICHGEPVLAAFPSILLIIVFFYLLFIQSPLYSSFSPVIAADRSLLVSFQFPLKPSSSMRTTAPSALPLK